MNWKIWGKENASTEKRGKIQKGGGKKRSGINRKAGSQDKRKKTTWNLKANATTLRLRGWMLLMPGGKRVLKKRKKAVIQKI